LYFSKILEDPRRILGKILVSKFLLNLLFEILKVLPNSEIYLNLKIKTLLIFFLLSYGISPACRAGPLLLGLPPSLLAQQARVLH
jgi:hypothetical protein